MGVSQHAAFELIRDKAIPALNVHYQEYQHKKTGALHIHLAADNDENVFTVALRTLPTDSTGVAHILEHTALCGSKKYPVKDPFMAMQPRSLCTFMNAMTSSDWTAYPFSSKNKKDFNNLLNVYLDSVFFPQLDPLAFAQEGHRLEFSDPLNSDSELVYKGVVFNEMKGVFSSETSQLSDLVSSCLYPTATYHHSSGGRPQDIPSLTYEQFKDFYDTHYHPSNATFYTYGDISAEAHQQVFEDNVLHQFQRANNTLTVADEQRYTEPQYFEEEYPVAEDAELEDKTHIVVSWLLGNITDVRQTLNTQFLCRLLVENSASPLRQAIESSDIGKSASPVMGLGRYRELAFTAGFACSNPEQADAAEALILQVLKDVAENGLPMEQVEASLHQFELSMREIAKSSYPYGMQLIIDALRVANHGGDAVTALSIEEVLTQLRDSVSDPDFIPSLVKELFLQNPHRIRVVMRPSNTKAAEIIAAEKAQLAKIAAELSDADKADLVAKAQLLLQRQEQPDNRELLPKVTTADVPATSRFVPHEFIDQSNIHLTAYNAGTNGLVYQQIAVDMPQLSPEELRLLPIYTHLLPSMGIGDDDYLTTQIKKAAVTGSFSVHARFMGDKDELEKMHTHIFFVANGLNRNQQQLTDFMYNALHHVRFDESKRILELISIMRSGLERAVIQQGHMLAMRSAASGFSPQAFVTQNNNGLPLLLNVREVEQRLEQPGYIDQFSSQLQALHQKVLGQYRQMLLVAERDNLRDFAAVVQGRFNTPTHQSPSSFDATWQAQADNIAWITNTQVNYCAVAFAGVVWQHPDSAKLAVLSKLLNNQFLHPEIREKGGAYGAGSMLDFHSSTFRFYSYRDPRLLDTIEDFHRSIEWVQSADISQETIDECILSCISSLDQPSSPAGEASTAFADILTDFNLTVRDRYRNWILSVTVQDVKDVAQRYLQRDKARVAVITNAQNAETLDFTPIKLS